MPGVVGDNDLRFEGTLGWLVYEREIWAKDVPQAQVESTDPSTSGKSGAGGCLTACEDQLDRKGVGKSGATCEFRAGEADRRSDSGA
jgi:hypothetical protein